jgi:hypothetical protein
MQGHEGLLRWTVDFRCFVDIGLQYTNIRMASTIIFMLNMLYIFWLKLNCHQVHCMSLHLKSSIVMLWQTTHNSPLTTQVKILLSVFCDHNWITKSVHIHCTIMWEQFNAPNERCGVVAINSRTCQWSTICVHSTVIINKSFQYFLRRKIWKNYSGWHI